ncbi:T9SS type A sorting domain-containing protein [bacterium]|nr:T9SS type A sorting domain-containing protein [bacterium]
MNPEQWGFLCVALSGGRAADPEHPVKVGYYDTPGWAYNVAISEDGLIYVADYTNVGIYRFTDPAGVDEKFRIQNSEFKIYPAYPNPFNSTTTITFGLDKSTTARLALYDMSGRQVRTLFNGYSQAGFHSVNLNADDLSSGFYLVRLETAGFITTREVILLK